MGFKVYATVRSADSPGTQQLKSSAVFANKMIVLQMNVTNDDEVERTLQIVEDDLAKNDQILWALVNNAGIITRGYLEWGSLNSYRKVFEVNVFGTVRVTRAFLPLIRTSKGHIITMSSIMGKVSFNAMGIYTMTKHSLTAFTDTLRRELYRDGVKVISIEPGYFKTEMSSTESFVKQFDYEWNQSSDDVKTFYGKEFADKQKRKALEYLEMFKDSDNLDKVVDDIIDAIIICKPKVIYRPMGLSFKIVYYFMSYSPISFVDWLLNVSP